MIIPNNSGTSVLSCVASFQHRIIDYMFLCNAGRNILSPISNLCSDGEPHGKPWQLIDFFVKLESGDGKKKMTCVATAEAGWLYFLI